MPTGTTPSRSSPGIANPLLVAVVVMSTVLAGSSASAQGRSGGDLGPANSRSNSGSSSHGHLLPLLTDGTPIEPSTWREETTESAEILDEGRWSWELNLVGGSWDSAQGMDSNELDWVHAEVQRGLGRGLQAGVTVESWERDVVQQGGLAQSVSEAGFGPTTLDLRQRLTGEDAPGPRACVGVRVRLPGSMEGPGAHVAEGGAFVPVSFPLGPRTNLGTTLEANVVSNALDTGRHVEGVSSLDLAHEFTDRLAAHAEVVGVWYGEAGRPLLGVVDASFSVDPVPHLSLTLGAAGGSSGGTIERGWFGRLSVHP
jgi:hypothetical protein